MKNKPMHPASTLAPPAPAARTSPATRTARTARTAQATEPVERKKPTFLKRKLASTAVAAAVLALAGGTAARAANHSDAPLIKLDPQANLTDVYTFVGTKSNDPNVRVLNVVVQVRPFSEPGDGAIFDRFSPEVRYSINITNPATGDLLRRYDFQYSPVTSGYKRTNTILSYGQALAPLGAGGQILNVNDANHNYTQTYTLTRVDPNRSQVLARGLLTPPPNVGNRVTPFYNDQAGRARSGAATRADLDRYTQQTIFDLPSGETVWSGHREDGFYSDIPGVFNLLDPRILQGALGSGGNPQGETPPGTPSAGTDGFRGYNVLVYAIQIPLSDLPSIPYNTVPNPVFFGAPVQRGVGVYASTARPKVTLLFDHAAWLMRKAIDSGAAFGENTAWCRAQLALIYFRDGNVPAAEMVLADALTKTPRNRQVLAAMGKVKAARHDFPAAITFYKKAIAVAPEHDTLSALGDLYALTGHKAEAEKEYAEVEALHRRSHAASDTTHNFPMAQFYADHDRNLVEALRLAEARKLTRNVFEQDTLAWCYYKNNQPEQAKAAIRRALRQKTSDARILYHAGMIYAASGEATDAQKYLYRAISLNPDFSPLLAPTAAAMLARLSHQTSALANTNPAPAGTPARLRLGMAR